MKRLYLFIIILVSMIVFCDDRVLAQPSGDRDKEILPAQIHHIRADGVHGLTVLNNNEYLISVSKRNDQGELRDVVLTITRSQNEDGAFSIRESSFGLIPYKGAGGLAVSSDGKMVLVCDTVASRIYEHDAKTGKLLGAIDTAGEPTDVFAFGDGTIWYLTSDGRLHHYLQDRRTKVVLDRDAGKPLAIEGARGLAVDSSTGEVVTGRGKDVIAVNAESGKVRVLANGFSHVSDVCGVIIDDEELFFVTDDAAGKIFLLKMDGSRRVLFESEEKDVMRPTHVMSFGQRRYIAIVSAGGDNGDDDRTCQGHFILIISRFIK